MYDYVSDLWIYVLLLVGIVVVPGMDMMFVLAKALTGGRPAGLAATLGIMAGGACHIVFSGLAVVTLGALVPALAKPMMLAGAAYMAWIGWTLARSSIVIEQIEATRTARLWPTFMQGLVTNVLNPKAWLFVLAVVPQFLKPGPLPLWSQAVVMAVVCVIVQGAIYAPLALAAARGRDALVGSPAATMWIGRACGALLIVAAVYLLAANWPG